MVLCRLSVTAGALGLAASIMLVFVVRADEQPTNPPKGVDILARGPVHEAYAQPTDLRPEPGPVVAKQPPDPIEELAPDEKPEGDDVQWIPGYFAWDDDASDFIWVSGFWRNPPPGRDWTPGHWQEVEGGWQWVPGYWAAPDVQTVEYLPPPPPSVDNGASVPAPDETSTYVPGCWVYRETRYFWRPGSWVEFRTDWCWIPDRYAWTPTGYLFIAGYWDYPLHTRGLLFAPAHFNREVLGQRDYAYTPEYVIEPDFLLGALFVRPAFGQYYFGDYFEGRYQREGFTSWIDYRVGRHGYDPNYAYYRQRFREDEHWESNLRDLYAMRRSGDVPRPPHTWAQQTQAVAKIITSRTGDSRIAKDLSVTNLQNIAVLTPFRRAESITMTGLSTLTGPRIKEGKAPAFAPAIKLEHVAKERQTELRQRVKQYRELSEARQRDQAKLLSEGGIPVKPTDPPKTVKVQTPKAPNRPEDPRRTPKNPPPVAPPPPPAPKHEDRPIPPHEPPTPSAPPMHTNPPTPKEAPPVPAKEPPIPPKEPTTTPREPTPKKPPTPSLEPPAPPKTPPPPKEPALPPPKEPAPPKEVPKPPPTPPAQAPPKVVPLPAPVPHEPPPVRPKDKPPANVAGV